MGGFAEYAEHDGLGLAELVRKGEVSPTELVEESISRIEALNPRLNSVVYEVYERAREQAAGPLPDGPFTGVPFLLKDLMAEDQGHPSTSSCTLLVGWRAPEDSELVARFKRAGVVVVGRTNTPEFGIYGVTEPQLRGPCRNPWDPERTPGGSSGGSGASVAARFVPLAHGGDGGGSIRIPSSHCGLVGLKPTRARNPAGPYAGERWQGLVCEHVITRSVRDSAAMLDATHGPDVGAPYCAPPPKRPYLDEVGAEPRKLRIAFTRGALFGSENHADCVRAVDEAAALAEELGHEVEEACPDFDRHTLTKAYFLVVAAGVSTGIRAAGVKAGCTPRAGDVEPPTWLLKLIADKFSASDYEWHMQDIHHEGRRIARFFEQYDVLITSTTALPPVRVGSFALGGSDRALIKVLGAVKSRTLLLKALDQLADTALGATPNTQLFNQTGQPAISLPLHWNEQGLPIGTQWVGRFGDEATLFRLAAQLEQARPWAGRLPPLLEQA